MRIKVDSTYGDRTDVKISREIAVHPVQNQKNRGCFPCPTQPWPSPQWTGPYPKLAAHTARLNEHRRTFSTVLPSSPAPTPPKANAGSTAAAFPRATRRSTTMISSYSGLLPTPRSARASAGLRSSTWPNSPATCNSSARIPAPAAPIGSPM